VGIRGKDDAPRIAQDQGEAPRSVPVGFPTEVTVNDIPCIRGGNGGYPQFISECLAPPSGAPSGSLGAIIGDCKSTTTRRINRMRRTPGMTIWQRNDYEHIIRTERALKAIRQFILDNPARWHLNKYNAQASRPDPQAAELWRLLKEENT
jgi:hypothetical protein